ncbi:MAG: M67 family metallopeptidase [Armatimonadetes bacterium]|jgi:proteasome lid subunit RPN8/RPN11|nr:M67 family metallopeptidase [Armatimonadota bacterium]
MPFALTFTRQVGDELSAHAAEGYPYEVVGVLAGGRTGDSYSADRLYRAINRLRVLEDTHDVQAGNQVKKELGLTPGDSSANRFLMTGENVLAIQNLCRRDGRDVVGFYHSHPDQPAEPSQTDLRLALGTIPGYVYVIVSVRNGIPTEITGWLLSDDRAEFVPVTIRFEP